MKREYYVYITTNPERNVLYTGMTNNLSRRLVEHYESRGYRKSFVGKNYCYCLIYFESFNRPMEAINAEKFIKGKKREWKENLINESNPKWKFLNKEVLGLWPPKHTTTTQSS